MIVIQQDENQESIEYPCGQLNQFNITPRQCQRIQSTFQDIGKRKFSSRFDTLELNWKSAYKDHSSEKTSEMLKLREKVIFSCGDTQQGYSKNYTGIISGGSQTGKSLPKYSVQC